MSEEEPMDYQDSSQVTLGPGHLGASEETAVQQSSSDSNAQMSFTSDRTKPSDHQDTTKTCEPTVITNQPNRIQAELSNQTAFSGHSEESSQVTLGTGHLGASEETALQQSSSDSNAQNEDSAKVTIKVEWKLETPLKWKTHLQKALQSWCNDKHKDENWEIKSVVVGSGDTFLAEVVIKPSRAMKTLKQTKSSILKFKELQQEATVHFLVDGDEMKSDDETKPDDEHEMVTAGEATPGSAETGVLTVPVSQYCYLTHAYRKELNQLENEFDVKINAEVSVSITAKSEKTKSDSVQKAARKFTDLVQNNTEMESITILQAQMESDIMKEVLRNIQSEEVKMVLIRSAGTCLLFAPKKFTSMLKKRLNTSDAASNRTSQDNSETLKMDIKDTQAPLLMNSTHWELLRTAFGTQLSDIKKKYGVTFLDKPYKGSVEVRAQNQETMVSLEAHALRALTHLYQKVAMSTVAMSTCMPSKPDYSESVAQVLKRLHSQHCWVDSSEEYGSWKLIGLPKHLLPAIADIEMEIGKSVFDDRTKLSLGYSDYLAQRRGAQIVGAEGGPGWAGLRGQAEADTSGPNSLQIKEAERNGKDKESVKSEEDNCPICMDTLTDKMKLKCGHEYCSECLNQSVKSIGQICPVCKEIFGKLTGNQPEGNMTHYESRDRLPGFPDCGTIIINYHIPNGIQTEKHPNPGQPYSRTDRTAYLPANEEGRHVLRLLKAAFDQKLIFTVGTSTTTGAKNSVTWNDVHHKTSQHGGPLCYGYPDPDYLKRVRAELKAKGIE